jgi:predicted phosphodiesterase
MSQRTVIISDTHFGAGRRAAKSVHAVRPLWQGADRLIINGDVAELHHGEEWKRGVAAVRELREACGEDGVQLVSLTGNHDAFLTDLRHLSIEDGRVFMTHGDALHPWVSPWSVASRFLRDGYEQAVRTRGRAALNDVDQYMNMIMHIGHDEWSSDTSGRGTTVLTMACQPWLPARLLHYWLTQHRMAWRLADRFAPEAKFVLTGHSHRPEVKRYRGRVMINTGGFGFPFYPLAVTIEQGRLEVCRIKEAGGVYGLRSRPVARFTLDGEKL